MRVNENKNLILSIQSNKIWNVTLNSRAKDMQKLTLVLLSCLLIFSSAKVKPTFEKLEWLKLGEAAEKLKQKNKPIIIDVYTDWCHWCKVMDEKTYSNRKVIDYLSENFYAVKLNAETRDTLNWNNRRFVYNAGYKINEFALFATNGQASFPTTVILLNDGSPPIPIPGYMQPRELELIVKYFGDGEYKTKTFPEYQKTFHASW